MTVFENMYMYYLPGCPFCAKVDRFLQSEGLQIEHRSVMDPQNAEDIVRIGGKKQSPCLIVDGRALYESDDIIEYLKGLPR